ncbi:hypothetical protein VKT23_015101 [Stygiomarasmius scandens]|uniref:Major facilitator superfamily (MFS) profile domain-containing protein n=1 Tax=Marasmiellus scandens TaxID=2682957 RepID=A0ABR1J1Y7_9AGAR
MHASGLRSVSSYSSLRLAEPFHQGRRNEDGLHVDLNVQDVPAIPTLLGSDEMTTPLPTLPMTVLSIMMLGEFLSSNVSTPFLLFMVKGIASLWCLLVSTLKNKLPGFGVFQEDSEAAFWTGILGTLSDTYLKKLSVSDQGQLLVATFFLTQFLTSLAWAIIADRYGRRIVLVSSLFGSAVTCGLFGTSTSLSQAIVIRLLQGAFAGSVGVARGSVPLVTNASNEGRAYAILGHNSFCWGFGGMLGPIIGGLFERPAEKWPLVFGNIKLFVNLPYLLPCAVAAAILLFGALLACFLGPNGESPAANVHSKTEKLMSQLDFDELPSTMTPLLTRVRSLTPLPSLHRAIPRKISRRLRNPSREPRFGSLGSSFFPSSSLPNRANTGIDLYRTFTASSQTSGLGSTRTSRVIDNYGSDIDTSELNLGERFVLANENAVNNISDLWVAAAISTDTEGEIDEDETPNLDSIVHSYFDEDETRGRGNTRTTRTRKHLHTGPSLSIPRASKSTSRTRHQASYSSLRQSQSQTGIFANTGVDSIVDLTDAPESAPLANLTPIFEARPLVLPPPPSDILEPLRIENCTEAITVLEAKLLWGGIPIAIIVQYGLLALHTTTHDQVFLSYLITEYEGGGLNLGAADFAQISV